MRWNQQHFDEVQDFSWQKRALGPAGVAHRCAACLSVFCPHPVEVAVQPQARGSFAGKVRELGRCAEADPVLIFHPRPEVKSFEMIWLEISLDRNIYNRLVTENSFRNLRLIPYFHARPHAHLQSAAMTTDQNAPATSLTGLCLTIALFILSPRDSQAETVAAYKYQDYQESNGRIKVQAQSALIEQTLGTEARLKFTGVIDAITGATPTGQPAATPGGAVPLSNIEDRRKAWTLDVSRQFGRVNLAVGAANSRESDYVSTGFALNTLTDFNQKNTTLLVGLAGTQDEVNVFYQSQRADKRTFDAIVGLTQLLDAKTTVQLNFSYGRATGYLSDPYKLIQKNTELLPGLFLPLTFGENRPDERDKWIAYASYNHAVDRWHGAVETSYRLYHDSFGITSHTVALGWFQQVGPQIIVSPTVRFYQQSAADFYHVSLDGSAIIPGAQPNPAGPFFSADYRLTQLRTLTYGVKLVWTPNKLWQFDVAWERYEMKGRDGITSASAYPQANILTAGLRLSW